MMFPQDSTLIGDVDCSGEVNSQDASLILQFVTNVIDELPCEANMTGLTPEQLQEIINMMDEQLSINYTGGGGTNYPAMISSISSEIMNWGNALIYCDGLEEDGYSDWFLPNLDQLAYAVSGGCSLPDDRTDFELWTTSLSASDHDKITTLGESGGVGLSHSESDEKCRCVRFGEGETSESSSNSSDSSSSISGNSAQPITMIGPMYRYDSFPNFIHRFGASTYGSYEHSLYYYDAIRFCSTLEHNGYTDWYLPSYNQIVNYYAENSTLEISNYNDIQEEYSFWTTTTVSLNQLVFNISSNNFVLTGFDGTQENDINYSNRILYSTSFSNTSNTIKCFCVR